MRLPHNWDPRPYQMDAWRALEGGCKRAILLWHRRAGKDDLALNWTAVSAIQQVGSYWHMLPQANQARKAIWDGVDPRTGIRRIDQAFPKQIRKRTREQDMFIEFINGSTWQLVGGDNFDRLVGASPRGIVFSEFALMDPMAWEYLSPILTENEGWAIFPTTPRGKNHLFRMWQSVQGDKDWLTDRKTVEDTGVISHEQVQAERSSGKDEALIQQEYYCSFESPNQGSYYAKEMEGIESRVTDIPVVQGVDCYTAWDLGMADATAIWIIQRVGQEIRVVDYYEQSGEGLEHYANYLKDFAATHGIRFAEHILPHDVRVRELGSAASREEMLLQMGVFPITIAPSLPIVDGIAAVRRILPVCWFDRERTKRGRLALGEYGRDWDDRRQCWKPSPRHDWSSHGADSFRYFAISVPDKRLRLGHSPTKVVGGLS